MQIMCVLDMKQKQNDLLKDTTAVQTCQELLIYMCTHTPVLTIFERTMSCKRRTELTRVCQSLPLSGP